MKALTNGPNIISIRRGLKKPEPKKPSKKQQIIDAWLSGKRDIWRLAEEIQTQPSYIASTLQNHGFINGYHDLYTTATTPLNIYSPELQGKMGFKNIRSAKYSVHILESVYQKFDESHDRAGQHHCLVTALTMYNRARFSNKTDEARIFKKWLLGKLVEASATVTEITVR